MLQAKLDTEGRQFELSYASLLKMMGTSMQDYSIPREKVTADQAALQRLLKADYVVQNSVDVKLPNLTGEWEGAMRKSEGGGCYEVSFSLRMKDSPSVDGTYRAVARCFMEHGGSGTVTGTLSPGNQLFMRVNPSIGAVPNYDHGEFRFNGPFEGPTKLEGRLVGVMNYGAITLRGRVNSSPILIKTYEYTISPKFKNLVATEGRTFQAGLVKIDSFGALLLEGVETAATARFQWHVDFNEAGRAVSGATSKTGEGEALFRKQPDGKWVLTEYRLR